MSSNQVRHAIIAAPRTIEVVTRPQQPLQRGQVRIAVKQVGVCGSEVQHWSGETSEQIPSDIGHEFAGEVIEVGPGVDNVGLGSRVAAWVPSGRAFADEAVVEARHCFPLADTVRYGCAAEPLACVVNGVRMANVADGGDVAFVGAGFMALLAAILNRGHARTITVASRREAARAVARQIGATDAVHPDHLIDAVRKATHNRGARAVYEFTGVQAGLDQAISAVAPGGTLIIGGFHQGMASRNPRVSLGDGMRVLDLETLNWKAVGIVNAVAVDVQLRERALARAREVLNGTLIDTQLLAGLGIDRTEVLRALASVIHVVEKAHHTPNAVTVIVGSDARALLATRLIRAGRDPRALIVVTRRGDMVGIAQRLGATHVVDPSRLPGLVEQLVDGKIGAGAGADFVYELTGTQDGLNAAMRSVRMSGKLVLGAPHEHPGGEQTLESGQRVVNLGMLGAMDVKITNAHFRDENVILEGMRIAVDLLNSGTVDPAPLFGPRFPLEATSEAFLAAASGDAGKVVVTP